LQGILKNLKVSDALEIIFGYQFETDGPEGEDGIHRKIIEYTLILAYAIVRNISFQTLSFNKTKDLPDRDNIHSTDAMSPRRTRSPLLPKRQASIVGSSSISPLKLGPRTFASPATIEGTLNHMTPSLKGKEQEENKDPIEGKVSCIVTFVSCTDRCLVESLQASSSPLTTLQPLSFQGSDKITMPGIRKSNDVIMTSTSNGAMVKHSLESTMTPLRSSDDVVEVRHTKTQCTKKVTN
jgi:hypothetical protein